MRATLESTTGGNRGCAGARGGFVAALLLAGAAATVCAPAVFAQGAPRDIVLMLDNSGSMRKNDPDSLTSVAVRTFLEQLEGDNRVAVIAFDQRVDVLMPLTPLDADTRRRFLDSLQAINYRGLLTNSPAALERSLYELRISGRADAEKSIVFLTDGIVDVAPEGADAGDVEKARWMKSTLADEAVDNGVRIFGIAFTDDADFELIQTLAKRTGGEYYRAYSAADIDAVFTDLRTELSSSVAVAASAAEQPTPAGADAVPLPAPDVPAPTPAASELPASEPAGGSPGALPALPETTVPELPQVSLPDGELPKVTLPTVSLGGDAEPAPQDVAPADTRGAAPVPGSEAPGAQPAEAGPQAATEARADAAPPVPPVAPAPPVTDTSPLMLILAIGGGALLLALVALIVVLARRRGGDATGVADPLMPKAFLNDIGDVTAEKSYELDAKPTIVGRLAGPDGDAAHYVVIEESTIGRRHALFEYKEHSFWVTDQNSLNGTFVNNTRIEEPTRLKHGDRVRFHKHEFEFLVLDMFETDRTMMSNTLFADLSNETGLRDGDTGPRDRGEATMVREDDGPGPGAAPDDPTITRH